MTQYQKETHRLVHKLGARVRKISNELPGLREELKLLVEEYELLCQAEQRLHLLASYDAAAALEQ